MSEHCCFFAGHSPCDGQLVRGHLLPRQLLKREFPHGVVFEHGEWRRLNALEDAYHLPHRTLRDLIDDERSWVPMCGGPMGNGGHHGRLDSARTLRIARAAIPAGTEEFAAELGLSWWLAREYGDARRAALTPAPHLPPITPELLRAIAPRWRELLRREEFIMVYAIQAGENGPVKIGLTSNPAKRIKTLQWAWRDLRLEEKQLHEEFAYARVRGEWFHPVPELLSLVDALGGTYEDWP